MLALIEESFPTEELAAIYFLNLQTYLLGYRQLEEPGRLVIGLGPGRCGSTSLAALLETVPSSCYTHETPPLIFWEPQPEQIEFHVKRFRLLSRHFSLVGDVSHWWLNPIEKIFGQFPQAKAVGLIRDTEECALSFMRIQGFGKGSFNPWLRGNDYWRSGHWDPTYPSYALPKVADQKSDFMKLELITRYVNEYNARLQVAARIPGVKLLLVRTEELGTPGTQKEIFDFIGVYGETSPRKLNVRRVTDGKKNQIKC